MDQTNTPQQPSRKKAILSLLVLLALTCVVVFIFSSHWSEISTALAQLSFWQVLLVLAIARRTGCDQMGRAPCGERVYISVVAVPFKHESPEFVDAWFELARLLEADRQFSEANEIYNSLIEQDPDNPDIWIRMVEGQIRAGKGQKALDYALNGPATYGYKLTAATLFSLAWT